MAIPTEDGNMASILVLTVTVNSSAHGRIYWVTKGLGLHAQSIAPRHGIDPKPTKPARRAKVAPKTTRPDGAPGPEMAHGRSRQHLMAMPFRGRLHRCSICPRAIC
jgi:hypothetical protein